MQVLLTRKRNSPASWGDLQAAYDYASTFGTAETERACSRSLERGKDQIETIRQHENMKLRNFWSKRDESSQDGSPSPGFLSTRLPKLPDASLSKSVPNAVSNAITKPRLGYNVEMQFEGHHIVNGVEPHCEPNATPERLRGHITTLRFSRESRRYLSASPSTAVPTTKTVPPLTKNASIALTSRQGY
jgi:hypothetical protein